MSCYQTEFFQLDDGRTYLKTYVGGSSDKDELHLSLDSSDDLPQIIWPGNHMFVTFTTDGNGHGKGFSARITFGIRTNCVPTKS